MFSKTLERFQPGTTNTLAQRSFWINIDSQGVGLTFAALQLVSIVGAPPLIIRRITINKSLTGVEAVDIFLNKPGVANLANNAAINPLYRISTKLVTDSASIAALAFIESPAAAPPSWQFMTSWQMDALSANGIMDFYESPIILKDGASIGLFRGTNVAQRVAATFELDTYDPSVNNTPL